MKFSQQTVVSFVLLGSSNLFEGLFVKASVKSSQKLRSKKRDLIAKKKKGDGPGACIKPKKAKSSGAIFFETLDEPATMETCGCPCCDEDTCRAVMETIDHENLGKMTDSINNFPADMTVNAVAAAGFNEPSVDGLKALSAEDGLTMVKRTKFTSMTGERCAGKGFLDMRDVSVWECNNWGLTSYTSNNLTINFDQEYNSAPVLTYGGYYQEGNPLLDVGICPLEGINTPPSVCAYVDNRPARQEVTELPPNFGNTGLRFMEDCGMMIWFDETPAPRSEECYVAPSYNPGELVIDFEPQALISYGECCNTLIGCEDQIGRGRRLNEASSSNKRHVEELEDGSISVQVESNQPETLEWMKSHVEEMQERLETGEVARSWDPLFKAYFAKANEIEMDCEHNEDRMQCVYKSMTDCGRDLIKAHTMYHDKVADTIREHGHHGVFEEHEVPESCRTKGDY